MQKLNLDYTVYCCDEPSFHYLTQNNVSCEQYNYISKSGKFDWTDFMLIRYHILYNLLQANDHVIYSDLDAIWLDNPVDELVDLNYDGFISTVHHRKAFPSNVKRAWGCTVCPGWMGFRKTSRLLIKKFIDSYSTYPCRDQLKINYFLYEHGNINKKIPTHSFELSLPDYELNILGISKNLIHRGKVVPGCKVAHVLHKNFSSIDKYFNKK